MITIKRMCSYEFYDLKTYDEIDSSLKKEYDSNNTNKNQYFAIIDGEHVVGHAMVRLNLENLTAEIINLYVLPQHRGNGLGDALLRTILNYLRINSFTHAIISGAEEIEGFLIRSGAKRLVSASEEKSITELLKDTDIRNVHIYDIEDFFSRKCKGSQ